MWSAFPTSDYYGAPPHPGLISRRRTCPPPPWLDGGEGDPEMVPTFTMHRSTGEVPSFAPAASPRVRRRPSPWPPHRHSEPASESTTHRRWSCTADRPTSTRLEPASRLRGLYPLVQTAFTPSRLACRTRVVWRCRPVPALSGLLPPSPASPGSGCPQLQRPAATDQRWSPFTSTRYMAPRGAPERHAPNDAAPPRRKPPRTASPSRVGDGHPRGILPGAFGGRHALEAECRTVDLRL